jgi:hypothetical protein
MSIESAFPSAFATAAPSATLGIDALGTFVAWDLRKVREGYTGPCIRVRRSSDNAEADIGFTATGWLDETALLAHTGAGSGFIRTWYDQIGGRHAVQVTAGAQPRIVDAGTVDRAQTGPRPAVWFDGTDDWLTCPEIFPTTPVAMLSVSHIRATGDTRAIANAGSLSNSNSGYGLHYSTAGNAILQQRAFMDVVSASAATTATSTQIILGTAIVNEARVRVGYGAPVIAAGTIAPVVPNVNFAIGARIDAACMVAGLFLNGSVSEILVWNRSVADDAAAIINAVNAFYQIY